MTRPMLLARQIMEILLTAEQLAFMRRQPAWESVQKTIAPSPEVHAGAEHLCCTALLGDRYAHWPLLRVTGRRALPSMLRQDEEDQALGRMWPRHWHQRLPGGGPALYIPEGAKIHSTVRK